jgi:predicted dehydrogenase
MMAAAKRSGKVLAFGMQMHYRRRYHKIKEIIDSGALGAVAQVWCTEYRGPYAGMKEWVWQKGLSGGATVEKNCHHYDLLNWWVGSPPTTVCAAGGIAKHHTPYGYTSEIVDHAWIINNYENGAAGMVGICFLADPKMQHHREFGVHGTEGRIFFSHADGEIVHVEYNNQHTEHYDMREDPWVRGGVEADFLNSIRTGEPPLVTGAMAKASLLVPMAAERSIEEKRMVHVNELA